MDVVIRPCPIHWFAYYGHVGTSSPVCRRCGTPNPRYDPSRDPFATDVEREQADL